MRESISNFIKGNARMKDESFEDYKRRQKIERMLMKRYLKGEVIHESIKKKLKYVFNKDTKKREYEEVLVSNTYRKDT